MKKYSLIKTIRITLMSAFVLSFLLGVYKLALNKEVLNSLMITGFTALLALLITFIPNRLERLKLLSIPAIMHVAFSVFVFLAMFCGEILGFYQKLFWWDVLLHLSSGFLLSLVGYLVVTALQRKLKQTELHPLLVLSFAVMFSIVCGVFWEFFEFSGDYFFKMNMQCWQITDSSQYLINTNASNPGLVDTMKDLFMDTAGSLASLAVLLPKLYPNRFPRLQRLFISLLTLSRKAVKISGVS